MEKLIDECGTPKACWNCQPEPCDQCDTIDNIFQRLKEYEDTDRMPDEISGLIAEVERLEEENTTMKMALGEMTRIKNDFFRQMQSYIKAFRSYQSALELAVPDENDREHFLQQAKEQEESHE